MIKFIQQIIAIILMLIIIFPLKIIVVAFDLANLAAEKLDRKLVKFARFLSRWGN
jgi:ABC-type maltose transport system permease subunit